MGILDRFSLVKVFSFERGLVLLRQCDNLAIAVRMHLLDSGAGSLPDISRS